MGEFDFYEGNSIDNDSVEDIRGITDRVSKYVFGDMVYPCICLREDIKLPRHKWNIISKLVKQGNGSKNICFYIIRKGEVYKAGALSGTQVKAVIDIIGLDNLFGFFSEGRELIGDRLYVLSS